jgi:carbonic anhydrase
VTATAEENVLVQLEHLHTLPVVAARLGRGLIRLHAWMFSIASGEMFAYDSHEREFLPLGRK